MEAACDRLSELGLQNNKISDQLVGIEICPVEAASASTRVKSLLRVPSGNIANEDFFSWQTKNSKRTFDVVVGNPPFIRYQAFPEPHRSRAMAMMEKQGLSPNRLTNIWVPFVVGATTMLRPGGRMALVLPAELLQVTYASQLRSFLVDRFKSISIIACNELFFENAEQEVVLLLADGMLEAPSSENTCIVTMSEAKTVDEVIGQNPEQMLSNAQPKSIRHDNEKWLKYFLSASEISLMRDLRSDPRITNLSSHAKVNVGVVTGNNNFFVLTKAQAEDLGILEYTSPLISRSTNLKGTCVKESDWKAMSEGGDRVHLLHFQEANHLPSKRLEEYVRFGEAANVHLGYKCSIREPWYSVPSVWNPDGFFFRQIYDFPRVVRNLANATSTDTIHRFTSRKEKPELIISNTYTWLTAASAEIEGRSYGGGVLELEPKEAERLLVPTVCRKAMPLRESDRLVRAGKLDYVLEENARIILREEIGINSSECLELRNIWLKMRNRRNARRRGSKRAGA